jgi:two-component system, OmpR family, response regulator VanR
MQSDILLLKNKSVLFVEDDEIIKSQLTEVLEMLFKEVYTASNGKDAYDIYEDESPDIIISDIKMPVLDGLALAEKIRLHDYEIPIILLTSFTEQELLIHAVNLSIDGYIIKPIKLETLIQTVEKSLQRKRDNQGLFPLSKELFYHSGVQELYKNGTLIQLGIKELELLKLLIANHSKTVTKEKIVKTLWPLESIGESSIKNLVLRIRKKIQEDIIISVRGVGYRLNIKVDTD